MFVIYFQCIDIYLYLLIKQEKVDVIEIKIKFGNTETDFFFSVNVLSKKKLKLNYFSIIFKVQNNYRPGLL